MFTFHTQHKKVFLSTLISIGAVLLFATHPIFAQQNPSATFPSVQGTNEQNGNNHDFNNDVQQGKNELSNDSQAQNFQKDVVDGEDQQAGEGDGQNNQQGVDEYGDIQSAENNQGVNEGNKDINNSGIDEVGDANNLNEQSQNVINEHQVQEEGEVQNGQQSENTDTQRIDNNSNQGGNSVESQNQSDNSTNQ